jgi:acetyltransferase-like isoleucine patch superfamily enzyme
MQKANLLARFYKRVRIARLNSIPGIRIGNPAYLSRSARLQITSDGRQFGGQIFIGDGTSISDGVIVATYGGSVTIGAHAYVGPYCVLYGHGGLTIGANSMIGAHTVIVPAQHSFDRIDVPINLQPIRKKGISIGENVWIGCNCCILDGVRIGNGTVIGAGAVVTKDVEPYSIAFGVPAHAVRRRGNTAVTGVIATGEERVTSSS